MFRFTFPARRQFYGPVGYSPAKMGPRDDKMRNLALNVFGHGSSFMKNAVTLDGLPEMTWSMPEIAVIGIRNSGKTSLIRGLLSNNKLTSLHVSGTPGSTPALAFFNVGDCFALVDTPGYGAVHTKDRGQRMIGLAMLKRYLRIRIGRALKMTYYCICARNGITERDRDLLNFLKYEKIPFTVVLTKIDSLGPELDPVAISEIGEKIFEAFGSKDVPLIEVSAVKGWNMDTLKCDIVHHAATELTDDQLQVEEMKKLSYLPPTVEEKTEIDERYPIWAQALPRDDDMPMTQWLKQRRQMQEVLQTQVGLDAVDVKNIDENKRFNPWTLSGVRDSQVEQSVPADHWSLPPSTEKDPFQLSAQERRPLDALVEEELKLPKGSLALRLPPGLGRQIESDSILGISSPDQHQIATAPSEVVAKKKVRKVLVKKLVKKTQIDAPKQQGSYSLGYAKAIPLDQLVAKPASAQPAVANQIVGHTTLPTLAPDIDTITPDTQRGPGMNGVEMPEADRQKFIAYRSHEDTWDSTEVQMLLEQNLVEAYDPNNDHGTLLRGKYTVTADTAPELEETDYYDPYQPKSKADYFKKYVRQKYILFNRKTPTVTINNQISINPMADARLHNSASVIGSGISPTTNRGGVLVKGLKENCMKGRTGGTGTTSHTNRDRRSFRKWARPGLTAPLPVAPSPHAGNYVSPKVLPKRFDRKSRTIESPYFRK